MSARAVAQNALNIDDLRAQARRFLPRGLFEYVDRGSEDDGALARNRAALDAVTLLPRVLVDVSQRTQHIELFGKRQATPLVVAPTAAAGLLWYQGELAAARAAAAAGMPFVLSTSSITPLELIAEQAGGRLWFQLYMWPDRAMSYALVERARSAGYEVLVVTVDTPGSPNREYNTRNGFSVPLAISRRNIVDIVTHPRWAAGVIGRYLLTSGMPRRENYPPGMRDKLSRGPGKQAPKNDALTWDDLRALRRVWHGPLVVKGILHPDDARLAIACGADGLIVSNHGGRNLDASTPPLRMLPEIAAAIGSRATVLYDSGVRRGSDVAKALALGAQAVLTGRAPLWGVAAAGEAGAARALALLQQELDRTMAFCGVASTTGWTRDHVRCQD